MPPRFPRTPAIAAAAQPNPRPSLGDNTRPRLGKLLKRYDDACAEGDYARARLLAQRALQIDPSCFRVAPGPSR